MTNLYILTCLVATMFMQFLPSVTSTYHRAATSEPVLAFISNRDGVAALFTADMNGEHIKRWTNNKQRMHSFVWSPDGTKIAYRLSDIVQYVPQGPMGGYSIGL